MKKFVLLCLFILVMAGCGSDVNEVFKDKIVPDFEQILEADSILFKAYENAAEAAKKCAENPTEENMKSFLAAAEKSDAAAVSGAEVKSKIGDAEYEVMDKLNLPKNDYDYLFDAQALNMEDLKGWKYIAEQFEETGDTETLTHSTALRMDYLNLEKVFLIYGAMDWIVKTGEKEAAYFKERMYCYPDLFPEDFEWLTSHEEIEAEHSERLDVIEENINEEHEYFNEITKKVRQAQNK